MKTLKLRFVFLLLIGMSGILFGKTVYGYCRCEHWQFGWFYPAGVYVQLGSANTTTAAGGYYEFNCPLTYDDYTVYASYNDGQNHWSGYTDFYYEGGEQRVDIDLYYDSIKNK
ncbi:MAG: hypothetical protein JXA60_02965 [Candidatus Coatesbacteria bacterium]|nr:hypothetical protein [Candidatus Coatesbacteria bacterium]